jgi:hypothetical protein
MRTFALLCIGVVVGWAASGVDWSREAAGQEAEQNAEPSGIGAAGPELKRKIGEWTKEVADYSQINRYQISSFGSSSNHGYYVVDSTTGRIWHGVQGATPRLVVTELPEK